MSINFTAEAQAEIDALLTEYDHDVCALVEDHDGSGICTNCGAIADGHVEPDAQNYHCDACGKKAVVGMELALLSFL